ncbi:hypothetical protein FCU45_10880 [Sulfurimonas crateris]|uniref:Translation initiation factor IF-2 N-terminal domain-containing protein n=1 Tax=Sulfurimonas crateris TaxID=2574727 RepID=A0A4U2Z331_9BACT|nr:translation initiation factor IF-2 N-terminal domain-containing protein [Sulfurimonas crateris]TKI68508.1 hypothetical protein FCU45_10880 [Sulfurimonas crateris]
MDKVNIKYIADELGVSTKEVFNRAVLMSMDVKSIRSAVSLEDAQKIFDAIMHNEQFDSIDSLFYKNKNLTVYLSDNSIDINFLNNISLPYTDQAIDNLLLFSYNFSDDRLQELYSMSLEKLNIEKYLKNKFNDSDFKNLAESIRSFSNDFEIDFIDNKPLDNLKLYCKKFKPQLISIEGIDFLAIEKNNFEIFNIVKEMTLLGIKFELSIVNARINKKEIFRNKLNTLF